jgi:nitroreductase
MNPVVDAIKSRRSVKKMRPDAPPPTKEQIELILDTATWAPNHHLTEPWRFIVIMGDERAKLGEAMSEALASSSSSTTVKPNPERLLVERNKPLGAPVILALISSPKTGPNVVAQEEVVAAGAVLQNLLLVAHSLGLSTMVRSGIHLYSDPVRRYLGMTPQEDVVGLVYLGHAAEIPAPGRRADLAAKVEWRGS